MAWPTLSNHHGFWRGHRDQQVYVPGGTLCGEATETGGCMFQVTRLWRGHRDSDFGVERPRTSWQSAFTAKALAGVEKDPILRTADLRTLTGRARLESRPLFPPLMAGAPAGECFEAGSDPPLAAEVF